MKNSLKTYFEVSTYAVDYKRRLHYSFLLKFMQDSAQSHVTNLGVGHFYLDKFNYAWTLGRLKIEMKRVLKLGDKFSIETFPGRVLKYVYPRYFIFRDGNDEIIGVASSLWTIFDLTKREAVIDQSKIPFPKIEYYDRPTSNPSQIEIEDLENSAIYKIKYSDLDINRHANNTKYVEWVFDLLPFDLLDSRYPLSLQINYMQEIAYNKEVKINHGLKDNKYKFIGYLDGNAAFSCILSEEGMK